MDRPSKRRRILSPDTDLDELRVQNNARLKTTFESIFEKYGKDFSGIGDEIDLETGEIIVNNGHLHRMIDEKDPGADQNMFDELAIETLSNSLRPEKEDGCQNIQHTYAPQALADSAISDVSWLSDDGDSLMGDVIGDSSSVIVGNRTQELRLSNIRPRSWNIESLHPARADGHARLSAVGRHSANLSSANTQPQQPLKATPTQDPVTESTWRASHLPKPVSDPRLQPAPFSYSGNRAKSETSLSPPTLPLWTPTDQKRNMPRWTRQEDSLLLYLLSVTALGYTEIKEHFKERFPHRSFRAIQDHLNRSCRKYSSWKTILRDRIRKRANVKHLVYETNVTESPWSVNGDQQLHSSENNSSLTNLLTTNYTSAEVSERTRDRESSLPKSLKRQQGLQRDFQRRNPPNPLTERDIESFSHCFQEHGRPLSTLSKSSTVKQNVRLSTVQEVHSHARSRRAEDSCPNNLKKLDSETRTNPAVLFEDLRSSATGERHGPPKPIVRPRSTGHSRSRGISNAAVIKEQPVQRTIADVTHFEGQNLNEMSRDSFQPFPKHKGHARLVQVPPAADVQATRDPGRPTLGLDLLRPNTLLTPRTDPHVDRKKNQNTLQSLSAPQLPQPSKVSPFQKSMLPSKAKNLLGFGRPSNDSPTKSNKTLMSPTQVVRRKSICNQKIASLIETSMPGQKPLSHRDRANGASRAIKFSPPLEIRATAPSTYFPSEEKHNVKGEDVALAKPSSQNMDLSDDELSFPIKTVGTPSAARFVSLNLKYRRKTRS